jgi:hypothetical protein
MALNNPAFESQDETNAAVDVAELAKDTLDTKAAPTATAVAVAAPVGGALATPGVMNSVAAAMRASALHAAKDSFRVSWDSVPAITAAQGSFSAKADDTDLGAKVVMNVVSWQYQWVAGPNDNKADIETLKYSDTDDGRVSNDGVDMAAHVADLKAQGYSKAKMTHRLIIVGEVIGGPLDGNLVQINLPDTGRRGFEQHMTQVAFQQARGKLTFEQANKLVLTAGKEKAKSGEQYTRVAFSAGV